MSSLLLRNIKTLVQAETTLRKVVKGADMAILPCVNDAYLLLENDRIAAFGSMDKCPQRADQVVDASGRLVLPS